MAKAMLFREFIDKMMKEGRALTLKKPVSRNLEMAGVFKALESRRMPIIGKDKESGMDVVCNIYPSKELVAESLGCAVPELVMKMRSAIENPKAPAVVGGKDAPVLEVEEKPDLLKLPIPLHTAGDGGPYFSSAVVFAKDPELGQNASFHRMMVLGKDSLAIRILPRHLNSFVERADKRGESLKIAFAVGLPINMLLAGGSSVQLGVDESHIANALSPIRMVELENGIKVPADAESVYLGEITKETHSEGMFVDLTETYDVVREQRVVKLHKVYHRKSPIHHVLLPGGLEHKMLMGMPREPTIWKEVEKDGIKVSNVSITPGGCSWLHGVVAIRKEKDDDGKRAIDAAFRGHASMKHVVIVDDDIDILNPLEVEWAIATRFQASKGMKIYENAKGSSLDPSADPHTYMTTKVGIDCTKSLGRKKDFEKAQFKKVNISDYI
jgi:UbiD family decarboxylase